MDNSLLYTNLLTKLNNAKSARKLTMAQENGFPDVESYKAYLCEKISSITITIPTIHYIDLLDVSGSMSGAKINAANIGLRKGIEDAKREEGVNIKHSLYTFGRRLYNTHMSKSIQEINLERPIPANDGYTALYTSLLELLNNHKNEDNKVLVNIFTDGEDNASKPYEQRECAELIKELNSKNFTITFVGTERDTRVVQRNLNIHESNTLVHNNTGESMSKAFEANSLARTSYSAKVVRGEDVSVGFYKSI